MEYLALALIPLFNPSLHRPVELLTGRPYLFERRNTLKTKDLTKHLTSRYVSDKLVVMMIEVGVLMWAAVMSVAFVKGLAEMPVERPERRRR